MQDLALDFLSGGGEMGDRIRAFDWSGHPLGQPAAWPQSLKTAVSLILNSQHPMWIGWGAEISFLYNDAYLHVLGLAKHPWALGRPASEVWAEIWEVCGPLADKVFRDGQASFMDDVRLFMNRGPFMEETYYSFSYSPIRDESGRVGGLFCPSNDVTPKVVGARRLRTLSELSSNALVERTVDAACATAAATLAKNPDDVPFALLYLNSGGQAALKETVGLVDAHLLGPNVWPLPEVYADKQPRGVSVEHLSALPRDAANQIVSEAVVLPVFSRVDEQPIGALIAGVSPSRPQDTEYKTFHELVAANVGTAIENAHAAEEEKKRADALAELDRAKTTFFSNVSHEFRTPLTLMLGPLEGLLARDGLSPADRSDLSTAHRNSLRLLKLVNSLLDFSRIEAGRHNASYAPVDLAAYTADLASNFRSAMEAGGVNLIVDCSPVSAPVYVDREMWEKVVLNLLSNAFKFTLEGHVAVRMEEHDGYVTLKVEDTGVGIPHSELPFIFERFHRVENARGRTFEGTGIGLALVQELVRMHGGTVTVESEVSKGSTFAVRIPTGNKHLPPERVLEEAVETQFPVRSDAYVEEALRWLPESEDRPFGRRAEEQRTASANGTAPRVLLAEDNADMRDYIVRLLGDHMHVTAVENGRDAVNSALKDPPDLVLSDVMMPVLDGFGLLRELRNDPRTSATPVILLSARAGEESRIEGVRAGADDYLVKPFSAAELQARVTTHLNLGRLRQETLATMRRLQEISARLIGESDLPTLLGEFLDAAIEITRADMGTIQLFDAATDQLKIAVQRGFDDQFVEFFNRAAGPMAACSTAMRERRRVIVEDVESSAIYDANTRKATLDAGALAVQSTPLITRSGKLLGIFSTHFRSTHRPTDRDLQMLDVLARQGADLIEQELVEEELRKSEQRFRFVNERAEIGYWDWDIATDDLQWSPICKRLFGIPADEEMTYARFLAAIHPDDRSFTDHAVRECLESGGAKDYDVEFRTVWADRSVHWIRAKGSGAFENDRPVRMAGIAINIDADKAAEQALRESEERFRELAEVGPQIIWLSGANGELNFVNRRWVEFSGMDLEAMQDPVNVASRIHPDDRILDHWSRAIATGTQFELEARLKNKDGEFRWFMMRSVPVRDEQGRIARWFGTSTDIHESKLLQLELSRANQDLEQFAYSVSHDLQEPVRSVKIFSELLAESYAKKLDDGAVKILANVREGATRMEMLVRDLLVYTQTARFDTPPEEADANAACQAALGNLAGVIAETGATVDCAPLPFVRLHAAQLQQLFQNLIGNAVKYHRPGVPPAIQIAARQEHEHWIFSIKDNGIGIEPQYREKIFGLFKRLHSRDEYSGTGIGLAICQRIVERHHGRIWVESELGSGSTFYVRFPV